MDALEQKCFFGSSHGGDRKPQKFGLEKPVVCWLNQPMSQSDRELSENYWKQFDKLQRAKSEEFGGGSPFPKGVFRFKTFEEADAWETEMIKRHKQRLSEGLSG